MALLYRLTKRLIITITIALTCNSHLHAQNLLNKKVSVNNENMAATSLLSAISKQGSFYFSYSSELIPKGKMVNAGGGTKTVKQVLDLVFEGKYQYKERDNYIIIQDGDAYTISGYVVDRNTGEKISYASVYENRMLASTMTNEQGYFKLKLKDKEQYPTAAISVSKGMYSDTLMYLKTGFDQTLTVPIAPKDYILDSIVVKPQVEKNWLASIFISSKQHLQGMNIGSYIAQRPVQTSFVPGLGTHGRLGAQVVNKFSLNILGGYTAGANGVEIGGMFNIDKGNVRYVQVGGLFNVVGGSVTGVQVGGLYNSALDSIRGVQISGLSGMARGDLKGVQLSGLVNYAASQTSGLQLAGLGNIDAAKIEGAQISGLYNYAAKISGTQISGIGNIAGGEIEGPQLSSIFNYAKDLKGTQVALFNIADTSSGYSLGLVNVVIKNGYHKLSIYTNEVLNTNISIKTGTKKLYSILAAGANIEKDKKAYGLAYGLGKQITLYKKFALNTEVTAGIVYLGDWRETASLIHITPELNFELNKYISIHAGPTIAIYYQNSTLHVEGYKASIPGYNTTSYSTYGNAWIGWQAGIDIF